MMGHSPAQILAQVSEAVPEDCRKNIVIIGSLAVGYHYFNNIGAAFVRTKDIDCVLEPYHSAVGAGQDIARRLIDAGWQRKVTGENHLVPGDADTPDNELPAVRLYPPGVDPESEDAWFIELLSVPNPAVTGEKEWTRLQLDEGHFGLPTFKFLSIAAYEPIQVANLGIRYARPNMMALANMLSHPRVRSEVMRGLIAGRSIKRSNKDLGRVLAIAFLADLDDYRPWAAGWKAALVVCFPDEWRVLAAQVGTGLRDLLASSNDLEEAYHTCTNGLLASRPSTLPALRAAGERLLGDAVELLEGLAKA